MIACALTCQTGEKWQTESWTEIKGMDLFETRIKPKDLIEEIKNPWTKLKSRENLRTKFNFSLFSNELKFIFARNFYSTFISCDIYIWSRQRKIVSCATRYTHTNKFWLFTILELEWSKKYPFSLIWFLNPQEISRVIYDHYLPPMDVIDNWNSKPLGKFKL